MVDRRGRRARGRGRPPAPAGQPPHAGADGRRRGDRPAARAAGGGHRRRDVHDAAGAVRAPRRRGRARDRRACDSEHRPDRAPRPSVAPVRRHRLPRRGWPADDQPARRRALRSGPRPRGAVLPPRPDRRGRPAPRARQTRIAPLPHRARRDDPSVLGHGARRHRRARGRAVADPRRRPSRRPARTRDRRDRVSGARPAQQRRAPESDLRRNLQREATAARQAARPRRHRQLRAPGVGRDARQLDAGRQLGLRADRRRDRHGRRAALRRAVPGGELRGADARACARPARARRRRALRGRGRGWRAPARIGPVLGRGRPRGRGELRGRTGEAARRRRGFPRSRRGRTHLVDPARADGPGPGRGRRRA